MHRAAVLAIAALSFATPGRAASPCAAETEPVAGGTWTTRAVAGIEGAGGSFDLAVDERDPRLVVVTDAAGVLVSRDGGCGWRRSLTYAEWFPTGGVDAKDVEVAGSGAGRSLHVLIATPGGGLQLASSSDDGVTWSVGDLPAPASHGVVASVDLVASPAAPALLVFARTAMGAGAIYARTPGDGAWRWDVVTQGSPAPGTCVGGGPCTAPTLDAVVADPASDETLWALGRPAGIGAVALVRSTSRGAWDEVPSPAGATAALVDVAPGDDARVMVVGIYDDFAVSRDGGRSWGVGRLPRLVDGSTTSRGAFDLVHFDRGRAFATVVGQTEVSGWAGNVLVFDGHRWADVSPAAFAGYDRTDGDGDHLAFVELAAARGPLMALTSTGKLMTFRR